jgi:integrase
VDLEKGLLTLPTTKAGETQYLPLNEEAQAILRSLNSWQRSKWVFPSENPASPIDPCNFIRRYRDAVKNSDIEWVTWHALRHTFASRLAMQAVPLTTIAALLRHSTTSLVRRYAHLSPDHLKESIERVSGFGKVENPKPERGPLTVESAPVSIPTVAKSVNEQPAKAGNHV